ncbi:MAG: hypothetical protein FWG72_10875 [Oscillospiraceae bacterium]|nr:hypothetical protein [Oscillospiraceae bacterium]
MWNRNPEGGAAGQGRPPLRACVEAALGAAGFDKSRCAVSLDGVKERRLPMGRRERVSRVKAVYLPEPVPRALGFHAEDGELDEPRYPLEELCRALELIDTPDGPVRGRKIECTVKDGAAVISVTYTELLREAESQNPRMGTAKTKITIR